MLFIQLMFIVFALLCGLVLAILLIMGFFLLIHYHFVFKKILEKRFTNIWIWMNTLIIFGMVQKTGNPIRLIMLLLYPPKDIQEEPQFAKLQNEPSYKTERKLFRIGVHLLPIAIACFLLIMILIFISYVFHIPAFNS